MKVAVSPTKKFQKCFIPSSLAGQRSPFGSGSQTGTINDSLGSNSFRPHYRSESFSHRWRWFQPPSRQQKRQWANIPIAHPMLNYYLETSSNHTTFNCWSVPLQIKRCYAGRVFWTFFTAVSEMRFFFNNLLNIVNYHREWCWFRASLSWCSRTHNCCCSSTRTISLIWSSYFFLCVPNRSVRALNDAFPWVCSTWIWYDLACRSSCCKRISSMIA